MRLSPVAPALASAEQTRERSPHDLQLDGIFVREQNLQEKTKASEDKQKQEEEKKEEEKRERHKPACASRIACRGCVI